MNKELEEGLLNNYSNLPITSVLVTKYYSGDQIKSRRMRWAGHATRLVKRRGVYRALVGKPEGKRPLGRLRRRQKDNINIQEVKMGGMDSIDLAQDRDKWRVLVNAVMKLRVP